MLRPASRPCVLIVNLGTPDQPTTPAVRRYLREFLSDRRVVETHPAVWRPVLEGVILRTRPKDSAEKYGLVWGDEGSPLLAYTRAQATSLQEQLGEDIEVRYAMRYGSDSIPKALDSIYAEGHRQLLVVPLYPQYSATTVASITDEVARWSLRSRDQFDLRLLRSFPQFPGYISALAQAIEGYWNDHGRPNFKDGDRLVLSYHGIPTAMAEAGDPYPQECQVTTAHLRQLLGLAEREVIHAYQSVFGPAEWLKPATIDTIRRLGSSGTVRVDVVCPGFVSDCLETLEEIDMQNREAFVAGGGSEFHYIPWGNDSQVWLEALARLTKQNLAGWL